MSRILFSVILISAFAALALGQEAKLVWSDEFEGKAGSPPDAAKWSYMKGGEGWGNKELQYYTESAESARLDGKGHLVIEASEAGTDTGLKCWYGPCKYTSARLSTKSIFSRKYGRFEARMRLPEGKGVWPAFWLLGDDIEKVGWPECGEIDIMEMIGHEPSTLYGTLHGPGYSGGSGLSEHTELSEGKFADGFNVFAVEWRPDEIKWLLNGKVYTRKTPTDLPKEARWAFDHKFFIILNLAIGGNWPGNPGPSTKFPARVEVDYVRVYDL
jgi:beta-glucanase (GH16 family)